MIQVTSVLDEWTWDESPCDLCPHRARCRQGEACAAFACFIKYGGRRWHTLLREPSVEQYERLYGKRLKPSLTVAGETRSGAGR
jgi:hypothetical protein